MVNEPGDDFLAGAGLAGQQHGGLGAGDARRLCQHVFPAPRPADHPAMAARRLQFARQRGDLGLEPCRHLTRLRVATRGFSKPLVRQRQRQMVRHPPPEIHIVIEERVRLAGQEEQRAEHLAAERQGDAECRAHPRCLKIRPRNRVA
jgi:hypothetical protein